jgi:hypothetical protein
MLKYTCYVKKNINNKFIVCDELSLLFLDLNRTRFIVAFRHCGWRVRDGCAIENDYRHTYTEWQIFEYIFRQRCLVSH